MSTDSGNGRIAERAYGSSGYVLDLLQRVSAGHYPFAADTPT